MATIDTNKKPVSADVMEGGEKVKGNRAYATAKEQLLKTFNPEAVRRLDGVAMHFLDRHVFSPTLDKDGKPTGRASLAWTAGSYVSNVELAVIRQLEDDYPELQDDYRNALAEAGYALEVVEAEPEAKILDVQPNNVR